MKKNQMILLSLLLLTAFNCDDGSITSPIPTGSIIGNVQLYDNSGPDIKEFSGVSVEIENTAYSALTDSSGWWKIDNVPQGTYSIKYSKKGFATYIQQAFQFVGGGTALAEKLNLAKLPSFPITILFDSTGIYSVYITVSVPDSVANNSKQQFIRAFIGSTNKVAANSPFYVVNDLIKIRRGQATFTFEIPDYFFTDFGILSGSKAYVVLYPATTGINSSYLDLNTKIEIFTNIGEPKSEVIEVLVP